jgi:uncharacterized protein
MVRSARDEESVTARDDQRRALVDAYTSQLLLRSQRSELTAEESSAIAGCSTLSEAMKVIEARRKPILHGAKPGVRPSPGRTVSRRRRTMLALVTIPVIAGIALGLLWLGQGRLIYIPYVGVPTPASQGLSRTEVVTFTTEDSVVLHGWFVPADTTPARFTVLMFNGNAGHRGMRAPVAAEFARRGIATLLFDYRGFGDNTGKPSEEGLARDARAARAYLTTRTDVDSSRIVYFGESLGAAVALRLATETTPPPFALVLRSPFTSLTDIGRYHYPYLPVRWLLRERYPSLERASVVGSPTLVIAGDRDSIIPAAQSRQLYAAIATRKHFVEIAGANHNDEAMFVGPELMQAVLDFVATIDRR